MSEPFPVVGDPDQSDMRVLKEKGAYRDYNAHYIPVTSKDPSNPYEFDYFPSQKGESSHCDEFVVFQEAQTLTRFWVELQVETPYLINPSNIPKFVHELLPHLFKLLQNPDIDRDKKLRNYLGHELGILLALQEDDDLEVRYTPFYENLANLLDTQGKVNKEPRELFVKSSKPPVIDSLEEKLGRLIEDDSAITAKQLNHAQTNEIPSGKHVLFETHRQNLSRIYYRLDALENEKEIDLNELGNFVLEIKVLRTQLVSDEVAGIFTNLYTRAFNLLEVCHHRPKVFVPPLFAGKRFSGTFNQFSPVRGDGQKWPPGTSRSSCSVNSLMFLSYLLTNDSIFSWEDRVDEIIDDGRMKFEEIVKERRKGHSTALSEALASNEKETARNLLFEYGGDALHVKEIPNIEEIFFLTHDQGLDTVTLTRDQNSSTTSQFFQSFLGDVVTRLGTKEKLGAIIQCNGYSYGLALKSVRTCENKDQIEYIIFDSHGCYRLNGHSNAFIYQTGDLRDAAKFLGHLIQYQNLDLGSFFTEEEMFIMGDYQTKDLNQVASYLFKRKSVTLPSSKGNGFLN